MTPKEFEAQCEPHMEALRALIEQMPYQGDKCEFSQKVCLSQGLETLYRCINGVAPSDFVDIQQFNELSLFDTALECLDNDPDSKLFEANVWFNESDDTTTAVETYDCLICADSKEAVVAMAENIHEMLNADSDLFINIEEITQVYPSASKGEQ